MSRRYAQPTPEQVRCALDYYHSHVGKAHPTGVSEQIKTILGFGHRSAVYAWLRRRGLLPPSRVPYPCATCPTMLVAPDQPNGGGPPQRCRRCKRKRHLVAERQRRAESPNGGAPQRSDEPKSRPVVSVRCGNPDCLGIYSARMEPGHHCPYCGVEMVRYGATG